MADDEQAARRHAKGAPERVAAKAEESSMGEIWLRVTGPVSRTFFGRLGEGVKDVMSEAMPGGSPSTAHRQIEHEALTVATFDGEKSWRWARQRQARMAALPATVDLAHRDVARSR